MDGVSPGPLAEPIRAALEADDAEVDAGWERLAGWVKTRFDRDAGVEGVLFLIGIQAQGKGYQRKLKKEAKQDVIMEGTYCAFETIGLYERIGADPDGNWIWECTVPYLPKLPIEQQEKLLRVAILRYFEPYLPS